MRRLIDAWWDVLSHPDATSGDDHLDLVSDLLFTLGSLAFGIGVMAIIGGGKWTSM